MNAYLDHDTLDVFDSPSKNAKWLSTLLWGDGLVVEGHRGGWTKLRSGSDVFFAKGEVATRTTPLMKVSFVDVGQGDAAIIETPDGKHMLIDAGEEKFLARYLAKKHSATKKVHFHAIVITHGDADHFAGLPLLVNANSNKKKGVVLTADQVFHNGLVKMKSGKTIEKFGRTAEFQGKKFVVDLFDDPREVAKKNGNGPFSRWAESLDELASRKPLAIHRLDAQTNALSKFSSETEFEVLGPVTTRVAGRPALPFLKGNGSYSDSHTINGNSVVLRVKHGPWRFLFTGDLNEEAEKQLLKRHGQKLEADVFKVPHHGSADFGDRFLEAVSPLVSVVSTGTTSERKEYLHPRANLLAALGGAGRPVKRSDDARPIVFVTRLAGAFKYEGPSAALLVDKNGQPRKGKATIDPKRKWFYGLTRANYGIVHVRCDRKRLLVVRSGFPGHLEPYAFRFRNGRIVSAELR